ELIRGVRITVGPPFYNEIVGPLLIVTILLMAVGMVLPWRAAAPGLLRRRFTMPILLTLAVTAALGVLGMRDPFALAGVGAAVLVLVVSAREYAIGSRAVRTAR
ncbi:MAG: cytochrome c-type biogenesis CcmF C-terminal domain-containing protein, partial [Dehalococcoidia bacterium]